MGPKTATSLHVADERPPEFPKEIKAVTNTAAQIPVLAYRLQYWLVTGL